MKKVFFLFFVWLYPIFANAAIDERKTDVYFANGIKTSQPTAIAYAGILEDAIINKYGLDTYNKTIGNVGYSYNETHGMGPDLIESLLQKIGAQGLFDRLFETAHERNLRDQVDTYKESITSGHKVLVVAHSQGNLFTYEAYQDIDEWMQGYLEVVSVASPAMFPVKENTPLVSWDNDLVAYLGIFNSSLIGNSVRKVSWELQNSPIQHTVGKPSSNYVHQSQVGDIYTGSFYEYKAVEAGVNSDVHAFTFYMGQELKDGNTTVINPFSGGTLSDQTAKTAIMAAIEDKLNVLEAKPSQWQIETENETTNVCEERRAKLVHFKNAVSLSDKVFPFNTDSAVIDGTERYVGKVYPVPDANGTDKYVLASAEGMQIVDVDGQGVIRDNSGNDIGCYQLDGTGDEIVKRCGGTDVTDGILTVDLGWKDPAIDLELSVTKQGSQVGSLDAFGSTCPREHWYIATRNEVSAGDYIVHVTVANAAAIGASLLPETVTLNVDAPDGGLDLSLEIPTADLLNMGAVAKIMVREKEGGGVGVAVEANLNETITYTATHYRYNDEGARYDYETVSLLNRVELGPIANAQIEITSLSESDFGRVVYTGYTSSGDTLDTNGLMLLPGSFRESLKDDGLYLIAATGGEDVDADDDLNLDAAPTSNFGTIHAVVSGKAIKANGLKVNILTEIGYQVGKELLLSPDSAKDAVSVLDDAAKTLLGSDINKDGIIDHADLHAWVPSFDKKALHFDYNSKIHPIVLKIYNADDIYEDAQNLIYPNTRPVAVAGEDMTINNGESVTFDGSGSYDSDGHIVEYLWRKGSVTYCSGAAPVCTVEGLTAGTHQFELIVKDDNGAVGSDTVEVSVSMGAYVLSSFSTSDYAYDVTLSADGAIAFVAINYSGIQIIDVSNPAEPLLLGSFDTYGSAQSIALSADDSIAYVADAWSGLEIIDVSNPASPVLMSSFDTYGSAHSITLSADGTIAYLADGGRRLRDRCERRRHA